jgi:hypothetical protein
MKSIALSTILLGAGMLTAAGVQAAEVAGAINANGSRQVASSAYRVSHPGTGHYIITFTTAFPSPYATCLYMPVGGIYAASGLRETTKSCDVTFINSSGKLTNVLFNFLAVPTTK